jgi:IS5 family transposase
LYILQQHLFSLEEMQKIEYQNRLPIFFCSLDLRPYAKELVSSSPQGAPPHDREAILRALLIAPLERITTFTALHRRLDRDLRFRYQCGFDIRRNAPSISTISRVFKAITHKGLAEKLFYDLVKQCYYEEIIIGDTIAIDSTAIDAYEQKKPKSKQDGINATWGAKLDSFGNKLTWFGYKIHLAVDTKSELPIALEVTPAHVNDGDMGPPLVETIAAQGFIDRVDFIIADACYDQRKNYEIAHRYNAQAIIPLNLRNEKEPPAGFSSHGTPRCSMGYDMVYWGCDGNYLKFRCPHALGKVDCPHGTLWCSSSNYGMVVKVNAKNDLRRFSVPHRNTRKWNDLYSQRSSVERCNSRLKEYLTANDIHVGGREKVRTHAFINAIVLLASALALKKHREKANMAIQAA